MSIARYDKEAIFETCFEDFYYYHLKLNLHFIVNFLNCENKNFRNNYKKIRMLKQNLLKPTFNL